MPRELQASETPFDRIQLAYCSQARGQVLRLRKRECLLTYRTLDLDTLKLLVTPYMFKTGRYHLLQGPWDQGRHLNRWKLDQ